MFFSKKRGYIIEPEEIFLDSLNELGFDKSRNEGRVERMLSPRFASVLGAFCVILFLILWGRVGYLQFVQGNYFQQKALSQSIFVSDTKPPRGDIIDRYGALLAGNTSSFDVVLYASEFKKSGISLGELQKRLAAILNIPQENLSESPLPAEAADLPAETTLLRNVDRQTVILIQTHKNDLPGVFLEERFERAYQQGPAFATLVGYVGLPSSADMAADPSLSSDTLIGKLGLEKQYESDIRGSVGRRITQVDAFGNVQKIKTIEPPRIGSALRLTLDAGLQQKAYEVLARYIQASGKHAGAVVAMDPRDGSIRALVSFPSFDNNLFNKRLTQKEYASIFLNPDKPLFNRAISGEYPPGSVIKLVIASGVLEERIIDPLKQIFSAGFIKIPNPYKPGTYSTFLDWKPLGWMDLRHAIAFSSNVYFYTVGGGYGDQKGLGIDRIRTYESLFGLGAPRGIDLPAESGGFIPDPLWKAKTKPDDPLWRIGDTYNVSIGQGDTLVTPLQVATYTAVFANGGTLVHPHIADAFLDPDTREPIHTIDPPPVKKDLVSSGAITIVREGMRLAVTDGSARFLSSLPLAVAGKTGTAQTGRPFEEHAWFTGFAPYDDPKLVITVLVEKGGEGSSISVPIAKEILSWYFSSAHASSTPSEELP